MTHFKVSMTEAICIKYGRVKCLMQSEHFPAYLGGIPMPFFVVARGLDTKCCAQAILPY